MSIANSRLTAVNAQTFATLAEYGDTDDGYDDAETFDDDDDLSVWDRVVIARPCPLTLTFREWLDFKLRSFC